VSADARRLPFVQVEPRQIHRLLAPLLAGAAGASVERREDGLVNTVCRVAPSAPQAALALRIYASGIDAFEKERRVHAARPLPILPCSPKYPTLAAKV
jgi:hypothetical protein